MVLNKKISMFGKNNHIVRTNLNSKPPQEK
jgi:hypothetical protein